MLALGAANITAGFLQGFPVSSSGSRTVIGDSLGSRSQLASIVTLLAVVAVLIVGGPVLAAFSTAALGALVVYAALRLVDAGEFRRFARFRRSELTLALATTAAVLAVGALYGVLAAIGLSILDLLRRVSRQHDGILGFVPGVAGMHDVDDVHGLCDELDRRGVMVALARVKQDLQQDLRRSGLRDRIGQERIFPTLPTAVAVFHQ